MWYLKHTHIHRYKLIDAENRLVVAKDREWRWEEWVGGGQRKKKIKKYNTMN